VLEGSWISPGTHINGIGATGLNRRELDVDAVSRADLVVVESMEQAKADCGELIYAAEQGGFDWSKALELQAVITGKASGRPSNEAITLFDALGVGTEDLAAAAVVLKKAKEQGIGAELPM
jgi:alanine dehydrogenase